MLKSVGLQLAQHLFRNHHVGLQFFTEDSLQSDCSQAHTFDSLLILVHISKVFSKVILIIRVHDLSHNMLESFIDVDAENIIVTPHILEVICNVDSLYETRPIEGNT